MAKNKKWHDLLLCPTEGDPEALVTCALGEPISLGFSRIVVGARGPYVELAPDANLLMTPHIPTNQAWRHLDEWKNRVFYLEYRTPRYGMMLYKQVKTVGYADYKPGHYYLSVWDVLVNGNKIVAGDKPKEHL